MSTPTPPPPYPRTVALCLRGCRAHLSQGEYTFVGGEWITLREEVDLVRRTAPGTFLLIEVASPEELEALVAKHEADAKVLATKAATLGLVVSRNVHRPVEQHRFQNNLRRIVRG